MTLNDRLVETKGAILVVEDEMLIALDIQMHLEDVGWSVLGPVGNVTQAQALLQDRRPAFAVLDVNLGKNTSFAFADELAEQQIPFVFLSGGTRDVLPDRFADRDLLQKPIRFEDLVDILRRHAA